MNEETKCYEENGLIHVSFQFFGKKDKGFYFHQPGICDGGWIISGHFDPNEKTYKVRYSEDSFACSRLKSVISFEPKECRLCCISCENKTWYGVAS